MGEPATPRCMRNAATLAADFRSSQSAPPSPGKHAAAGGAGHPHSSVHCQSGKPFNKHLNGGLHHAHAGAELFHSLPARIKDIGVITHH